MDEVLFELLAAIAEILLELFLELVAAALVDLASRLMATLFKETRLSSPVLASVAYGLLGILAGGLSLVIFPHPVVHPSKIHGISLLVGPFIAGMVMSMVGSSLRSHDKKVVRIESFGYGFAFAFGMALIRFLFVK